MRRVVVSSTAVRRSADRTITRCQRLHTTTRACTAFSQSHHADIRNHHLSTHMRQFVIPFQSAQQHAFHSSVLRAEEAAPAVDTASSNNDAEEVHPTDLEYDLPPTPPLSAESPEKVDALFHKVLWLDMIEVHLLTQLVHERMGGHWSELSGSGGPVRAQASAAGGGAEAEEEEAKSTMDLKLVGFDSKAKIKVIKEIRAIAGLGLKEAKELVESAPKVIQKDLSPEKAEELKAQIEAVGGQIEIV